MKDILLKSLKVFGHLIIVGIACFFIVVSFNALKIGLFSKNIGYDTYGSLSEEAQPEFLYTYHYDDGEDEKAKEFEDKGYKLIKYSIRSDVEKGPEIALSVLSQIFCLAILMSFIYNDVWRAGNKDFEATRIHGKKFSMLKGLYIGLIANIPSFVLLTLMYILRNGATAKLPVALYTYLNSYAFEIIFRTTNGIMYWADVQWWQALVYYAVLIIVPIICLVSYIIGFKDISIAEKLVYKNSKKKIRRV
ncbi:MAG: hypothetical protein J6A78_03525 [Clostridia bacterium]|nr:hypothetical protein [Clostridia bacterium]